MATFKFKVLKGGKVYGEATTKAEAEAVAKKIGGSVAEVVGAGPVKRVVAKKRNPSASSSKAPSATPKYRVATVTFDDGTSRETMVGGTFWNEPELREYYAIGKQFNLGTHRDRLVRVTKVDISKNAAFGNPKNPPLERASAAALLDAVKPGKPQVIHGVKVARVGAGYSIDRMVLSRELAIKRLEGGKAKNPAMYLSREPQVSIPSAQGRMAVVKFADPYVGNDFVNGLMFVDYDPKTLRATGQQRIATAKGKDTPDYDALWSDVANLLRASAGKINASIVEGKTANPKAKPKTVKAKIAPKARNKKVVPPKSPVFTVFDTAGMAYQGSSEADARSAFQASVAKGRGASISRGLDVIEMRLDPNVGRASNPKAKPKAKAPAKPKKLATRKPAKTAAKVAYI